MAKKTSDWLVQRLKAWGITRIYGRLGRRRPIKSSLRNAIRNTSRVIWGASQKSSSRIICEAASEKAAS
jgi:hypothetical protein